MHTHARDENTSKLADEHAYAIAMKSSLAQ